MTRKDTLQQALQDAMPIILAYFPIAMMFGVVATASRLPGFVTLLISLCVYAGGAQFMLVTLIASGTAEFSVIITVLLVNLRHFLYGTTLGPRFALWPEWKKWVASFGLTDEVFAVTSTRLSKHPITPGYQMPFAFACYASWVLGTIAGIAVDRAVPASISSILSFALPALFIALLFIGKRGPTYMIAAFFGAVCALAASLLHIGNIGIVAGAIVGATIGMAANALMKPSPV